MLKKIAAAVVGIVLVLALFIASRPSEFQITRTRTVAASPDVVHVYVNDFHKWSEWSPWEKLDPALQRDFSGPPAGTGASYHWVGNDEVGEGRMTITGSQPAKGVTIRLEFIKPWTATNTTQFDLEPQAAGTKVTWTMSGHNNFMSKAFSLFMDMDKMIGADFEKGLEGLDKASAAAKPQT